MTASTLAKPWRHHYRGRPIDPRVVVIADGSFGNGFFLSEWRDSVITAYHVVEGATNVRIEAIDADQETVYFDACALAWDAARDIAVLRLPGRVRAFTAPLQLQCPTKAVRAVLQGYESLTAWQAQPRQWFAWDAVLGQLQDVWLIYGDADADGQPRVSPGINGYSGAAVIDPDSGQVVGVHHGAEANQTNRASLCDLDYLGDLRKRAYDAS